MNHLIRSALLIILIFPFRLTAQETKEYAKLSFSVRGKYVLFGLFEDTYWRAYSYGGEIYIGKHHAIGVDGGVFRIRHEEDDSDDEAMYSDITRRSYVYLDYKYIHPFSRKFSLYGQLYSKLAGRRMDWIEQHDYTYETTVDLTFLNETVRGTYTDIGIGIGAKFYFTDLNLGADISLNAYKHAYKNTATHYSLEEGWSTTELKESVIPVYLRVNLFYHFLRFKKQ